MDPLSITATVVKLVVGCSQGLQTCNRYYQSFQSANLQLVSMQTQCSVIENALLQIQEFVTRNAETQTRSYTALELQSFERTLSACQLVFAVLNEKLIKLSSGSVDKYGMLSWRGKSKNVWNERELNLLLHNVEGQASAITLLLSTLQLKSQEEISRLLSKRESQLILRRASSDAASLASMYEASDQQDINEIGPRNEMEFAFDFEINQSMNTNQPLERGNFTQNGNQPIQNLPSAHTSSQKSDEQHVPEKEAEPLLQSSNTEGVVNQEAVSMDEISVSGINHKSILSVHTGRSSSRASTRGLFRYDLRPDKLLRAERWPKPSKPKLKETITSAKTSPPHGCKLGKCPIAKRWNTVVVGPPGCGKSKVAIQMELCSEIQSEAYFHEATILVDGHMTLFDILDSTGQEEYTAMRYEYYGHGELFFIVYSVNSRPSFDGVMRYYKELMRAQPSGRPYVVLVGNSSGDNPHGRREVSEEQASDLAAQMGCFCAEVEDRDFRTVDKMLRTVASKLRPHQDDGSAAKLK